MAKIKWYKRDPNAALVGMMCLSLEERGAYNTILDLIYDNGGKVINDDRFLAGWMRCDVRVWRRIKSHLLELKKLYIDGEFLRSYAADRGVHDALHRIGSAEEAGRASALRRAAQSKENNEIASTPVATPVSTNHSHTQKEESKSIITSTQLNNSEASKSDFQKIYETGIAIFPNLAPANTSSIHQWLKAGCDVEKDILPELRRQQGKQIRGWAYFSPAIADAKKTRTEPLQEGRNNGKSNGSAEKRSPLHDWKDAWQHAIEDDNQRQQNQLGGVQVSGKHTLASPDNSEGFADLP